MAALIQDNGDGYADVKLTRREVHILSMVAKGYTRNQIAYKLYISPETVKKHLRNCYKKLGVQNKTEAVRKAMLLLS